MKTVIFTQGNNIDGISCAVLAKLVDGEDCEIVLSNQSTINNDFIEKFNIEPSYDDDRDVDTYNITGNEPIKMYDKIYMTDLCIYGELLRRFGRAANSMPKLRLFDHHDFAFEKGVNNYCLNCQVKKENDEGLCSSTSMFYDYLKSKRLVEDNKKLKEFVNLVRVCDTLDECDSKIKEKAENLNLLFEALKDKDFASAMMEKLIYNKEESFEFTSEEIRIIEKQKEKQENIEKE